MDSNGSNGTRESIQAVMWVRVTVPPTHNPDQAAEEVRKSIGFGHPRVTLLGSVAVRPGPDGEPVETWLGAGWAGLAQVDLPGKDEI